MNASICVLPGDGIGPEITTEALHVLQAIETRFGHTFTITPALIGGAAIDETGDPFPKETQEICAASDAILLGAVGGPKWDDPNASVRPEQGLLRIRKQLGLFANLRPVRVHPALADHSPLRPDAVAGVDIMTVRELTGGIYFGKREKGPGDGSTGVQGEWASDECRYSAFEIERIARLAFGIARSRSKRLASLDKANVLETSRLWRRVVDEVAKDFPDVEHEHILIDSATMHVITNPRRFDVILTENMFGDIISDETSVLAGSLGVLGSASMGDTHPGLFEPIHGSAPDIAGKGIANPIGTIAATAMLLREGLGLDEEASVVEQAIDTTIEQGIFSADLGGSASTTEIGDAIVRAIEAAEPVSS